MGHMRQVTHGEEGVYARHPGGGWVFDRSEPELTTGPSLAKPQGRKQPQGPGIHQNADSRDHSPEVLCGSSTSQVLQESAQILTPASKVGTVLPNCRTDEEMDEGDHLEAQTS